MNEAAQADRYLTPGTKVRRVSFVNDDAHLTSEYGIVVHCWKDESLGAFDCYVAFFGDQIPDGPPTEKPYVLRYASISLMPLSEDRQS